jgi:hypothetical protein
MLAGDKPLTFNDMLSMLHVYFWWNDAHDTPADYLNDLLEDLDEHRFKEAVGLLHTNFTSLCSVSEEESCLEADGFGCFKAWLRKTEEIELLNNKRERAEAVTFWLDGILDEEDDDEIPDTDKLAHHLGTYAVQALIEAGIDPVEATYARHVLDMEEERRVNMPDEADRDDYALYRAQGKGYEEAQHEYWPEKLCTTRSFRKLMREYEDVPPEAAGWDVMRKRALAKRFIAENPDFFQSIEDTYQLEENGVTPAYVRRFAEEMFPPGQRC